MPIAGRTHKPVIDCEKCRQCNTCRYLCPDLAITQHLETDQIIIDLEYCKGCEICAHICPKGAISMVKEKNE